MKPIIEMLAPDLYAVNTAWFRKWSIDNLHCLPGKKMEPINVTNTGRIVLDREGRNFPILKSVFLEVMKYSDYQLNGTLELMRKKTQFNNSEQIALAEAAIELELKRREIKRRAAVLRGQKKSGG